MHEALIDPPTRRSRRFVSEVSRTLGVLLLISFTVGARPTRVLAQQAANSSSAPTQLLSQLMLYRIDFVEPASTFDSCSMLRVMAAPSDFPRAFAPLRRYLAPLEPASCKSGKHPTISRDALLQQRRIFFDSVSVNDSGAVVYLNVRQGENLHHEDFDVQLNKANSRWGVKSVRIWGASQESPKMPPV